jgi:ACS family sodium-dependent inorganic phosphate cotransporter-like MFS transporter 5
MWPAMANMWTHWAPNLERGRLIAFSASGSQVGIIGGFSLGGYLCVHGFDGGWPSIFYIFGKVIKDSF